MPSNPNQEEDGEEYEEEEEDEEEEDDDEYDPEAEALNAAVAASLEEAEAAAAAAAAAEAEVVEDSSEVEIMEAAPNQEDGDRENEEEEEEEEEQDDDDEEKGKCDIGRSELDQAASSPNCTICLDPWTSDGPHRVCCIPCGHVYGKSCLEKWLRCRKSAGKCPQCSRKFKPKEIINLYAPLIVVPNDGLEKEVRSLREDNEILKLENSRLQEEIRKQKMHAVNSESSGRQKMLCLERTSSRGSQRRLCAYPVERLNSSAQTWSENRSISPSFCQVGSHPCNFVLQKEIWLDGARVMGIDPASQIVIVSGKAPGAIGEHLLNKISLLGSNEIDKIKLPSSTGVIRDMCFLPNDLLLLASLGRRLSLFSMASNNCVINYDLPAPAWSCSGDFHSPYQIYTGLQNGMLLVFDLRLTSTFLHSMDGLSRHPIHTIHSIAHVDNRRNVVTASSAGPCVWDVSGSGERPFLIPDMENYGICISLACSSSTNDLVASFRPKIELSNDITPSQASVSPSPSVSGSGRLGSHVLLKKTRDASYGKCSVGCGNVSEVRMSKSAIISTEGNAPIFACGDELSRRVCLWNLPDFDVHNYLRPHPQPILDLKYARGTGPGFIGCISEDKCQVFTCF